MATIKQWAIDGVSEVGDDEVGSLIAIAVDVTEGFLFHRILPLPNRENDFGYATR